MYFQPHRILEGYYIENIKCFVTKIIYRIIIIIKKVYDILKFQYYFFLALHSLPRRSLSVHLSYVNYKIINISVDRQLLYTICISFS